MLSCVAVLSPPTLCRAFSLSLFLPTTQQTHFTPSLPLRLQGNLWLPLSLMLSTHATSIRVDNCQTCSQIVIGSTIVAWGLSHCEIHCYDGSLVTFPRCESDVRCFDAMSKHASCTPRCWWKMCDFMSCAFRFCWCVKSLQGLLYGWVNCTFKVTSSLVQQCFFVQV